MMVDEAYLQVAISSFSWSGAMWSIAKELIGDKVVDIIIGFIPGFGQSDDVKDAIKAAKNGDWFEFTAEIAGIALQNTPWGKLGKLIDVAPEIVTFYQQFSLYLNQAYLVHLSYAKKEFSHVLFWQYFKYRSH